MVNIGGDEYIAIPMEMAGGGKGGSIPQLSTPIDRSDIIEKIKPEHAVGIIRQHLMGKDFIKGAWVDVPALKDRKLTEVGAWELSNLMLGVSSINVSISKLKDSEIKERAFSIAKSAQRMMLSNWKDYGIKNVAQFYYVHQIIFSNTLVVLKQADDASIQDLIKGTSRSNIGDYPMSRPKESAGRKIGRMLGLVGN